MYYTEWGTDILNNYLHNKLYLAGSMYGYVDFAGKLENVYKIIFF